MAKANTSPHKASNADRMRDQQIALLYTHGSSLIVGNGLGVLSSTLMLWDAIERTRLLVWLFAVVILTALRAVLVFAHDKHLRTRLKPVTCGWLFVAGTTLSGISWGVLGFLPTQTEPITLAAVGIILAGLTGASGPAMGTFYPAYAIYTTTAVLPFAALCFAQDNSLSLGMGVVAVCYYFCALLFGWISNRFTRTSISLRFENLELLRQLQIQTQAAEAARLIAENANASKTRFLTAASHDLRQPLQSITLLAEALKTEPLTASAQRMLTSMGEACGSMGELMNELMDYSRIDSGSLQAEMRAFDLAPLLSRIEAEFAPLARQGGLQLRVHSRSIRVVSDARMVERIIRNLVSNAVKYTQEGGVLLACRLRHKHVRLEVWDTGSGIPPEKQPDVFREFYQLDNPERDRRKGLGLGLAIVDGLAKLLGEELELRSVPGKGSVFAIRLPLDSGRAHHEVSQRLHWATLPSNAPGVLVIDNEPVIQQAMVSLLAAWGCRAVGAESLDDALARLDAPPDAILADYRLCGGHTGIEAVEGLRRHFQSSIPAALITGDTDPHRLAEARASGLPLLQKPTPSEQLREILASLLRNPPLSSQPLLRSLSPSLSPSHSPSPSPPDSSPRPSPAFGALSTSR